MQAHRHKSTIHRMRRERGLTVIIAYKMIKGVAWLILAPVLAVAVHVGLGHRLVGLAAELRHGTHAWSLQLAELLLRAATPRGLWTIVVALLVDGIASLIEGWALVHGRWWGPWLVVVTTSLLLPLEAIALVHHPHFSRFLLLAVNVAIVVYLARKALLERRAPLGPASQAEGRGE
jgi:uncharacterized membrane protein (DUF2068 family)